MEENKLRVLEKQFEKLASSVDQKVGRLRTRLNRIVPHTIERQLDILQESVENLSDRFKIQLLKSNVLTEVRFYSSAVNPSLTPYLTYAISLAYDKPDDWWMERKELTIGEWQDVFVEILQQIDNEKAA